MSKLCIALATFALATFASAAVPFKFGIAGYTFNRQDIDHALAAMRKVDCHYLCIKDFHLKYDANDAEIAAFKAKLAAAGVEARARVRSTSTTRRARGCSSTSRSTTGSRPWWASR